MIFYNKKSLVFWNSKSWILSISFFIAAFSSVYGQNNRYVKLQDDSLVLSDSCLTNRYDFESFKLIKINEDSALENLKIQVEANYQNEEFSTLEDFNTFEFKFWLLSTDSFKNQGDLKIRLVYDVDSDTIEQLYIICLRYIYADSDKDRGGIGSPDFVKLPVFFGTDRNYTNNSDPNDAFGVNRSKLKYGIVEVSIPHDHRIGELETPSIWRFEFTEDPSKHIMLHNIKLLNKEKFFSKLSKDIQSSKKKRTFLFIHGFNTSFSEAAKRTAQISYDLKFDGKPVFYSWPSQASTFRYGKDEENIAWSRRNIKTFLNDYLSDSGAEEIYLVAHSMGNRGLTRAMIDVLNDKPELKSKIKEIILAAPDIDAKVFKNEIAPQMVSLSANPITLYVSEDDLALKASEMLHGNPRAGDAGEGIVILNGVETIDASGVDTSFLRHSYFADTNSIISDIFDIIESGKRALKRTRLSNVELENQIYWKVKQ
ncbi:alpha/beta hydrolase [Maribacter chungangensis]|uniref:Alpha/beta hydrolase n=1 Tax=Maribacter chungangensis TaxID=1069117 RepID=A0ABW3B294_9FLAO